MKHYNYFFAFIALFSIVVSGCTTSSKVDKFLAEADQQIAAKEKIESSNPLSGIVMEQQDTTRDPLDNIITSNNETTTTAWYYKEYSQSAFQSALGSGQRVVLFFHAGRCPSCVALEKDIVNNPSSIPGDTTILKINYDQASDLKAKYKVNMQNTIIIINSDQTESARASNGIYRIVDLISYL